MKKLLIACLTSLICVCYANAQNNDIPLSIGKGTPDGGSRTVVQLPTATIDGRVLTISFADDTDFSITITDALGSVVYVVTYTAREATITLPQLPEGIYYLRIEDEYYVYIGEFEIAD